MSTDRSTDSPSPSQTRAGRDAHPGRVIRSDYSVERQPYSTNAPATLKLQFQGGRGLEHSASVRRYIR